MEPDEIQREGLNAGTLSAFHRLDFSAFYQWGVGPKARGLQGKIGLSLLNIYNRRNTIGRVYRYEDVDPDQPIFGEDHNASVVNSIERFGLGFTPNLSLFIGWK